MPQSIQTKADQHHAYWQEASEGVVFSQHSGNESQYGSAGLTRAGGVKPNENTIFEIGSITKVFTSILLAEAVREKRANFDDVVASHLPELEFNKGNPFNSITLSDLATHTSGLPRVPEDLYTGADSANPYAHYNEQRVVKSLLAFRKSQLEDPGEYSYSNYGMGILGYVITQIYGQPFRELLKDKILDPLEMDSTDAPTSYAALPAQLRERIATPHVAGKAVSHFELSSLAGAGAMISTAEDLIRFGTAHWDPNTPVGLAASLAEVAKPRFDDQGLGWGIDGDNLWHNGGTGGSRSDLKVNRKDKTVSVFLANSYGLSHEGSVDGNFESLHGYWSGVLKTESVTLRLESYLDKQGRMFVYSIDRRMFAYSVDQGYSAMVSSKSIFNGNDFLFSFPSIPGVFDGELQGELEKRELTGSFTQGDGVVIPLTMRYSIAMPAQFRKGLDETMRTMTGDLARLNGYWSGYLDGKEGLFAYMEILTIGEIPVLQLYSPHQHGRAYMVLSASLKNDNFKFISYELDRSFTGTLASDGKSINGTWSQGSSTPITLRYSVEKPVRE